MAIRSSGIIATAFVGLALLLPAQSRAQNMNELEGNGGNWRRPHMCTYSKNGIVLSQSVCHRDRVVNPVTWTWENGNVAVVHENDDATISPIPLPGRWNGQAAMHSDHMDAGRDCFKIEQTNEEFCVEG